MVSEKVSDSVSEKFDIGKKFRIRFRSDFGYRYTLDGSKIIVLMPKMIWVHGYHLSCISMANIVVMRKETKIIIQHAQDAKVDVNAYVCNILVALTQIVFTTVSMFLVDRFSSYILAVIFVKTHLSNSG